MRKKKLGNERKNGGMREKQNERERKKEIKGVMRVFHLVILSNLSLSCDYHKLFQTRLFQTHLKGKYSGNMRKSVKLSLCLLF